MPAGEPEADLEGQARAWIVRLKSGVATEQDLRQLARWRAASPAAEAAFDRARRLWAMMGSALEADAAGRVIPLRRRTFSRRGVVSAGGAAIAAGAVGVAYLGTQTGIARNPDETFVATAKGERRLVTIAEGATADLNTGSRVRLWKDRDRRGIDLLRGEAVVVVAAAPQKLVARVGHTVASALDGRFLLRRQDDVASILCLQGQVFAVSDGQSFTLEPRAMLLVDGDGARLSGRHDVTEVTSWQSGQLVYEDRPLLDVVNELNRYRDGRIVVRGEALGQRRVSGVVQLDRIDGALTNFARSLNVEMTRLPGGVVILG